MNIPPPVPHAPPAVHLNLPPPAQFHELPRPLPHHERPIEVLPHGVDDLNRKMSNFHMNDHGFRRDPMMLPLDVNASSSFEGWTFRRVVDDDRPAWTRASKSKLNLDQKELAKLVLEGKKKKATAAQYKDLPKLKRDHVDRVIEEMELQDPRYSYVCAYVEPKVKEVRKKGKFQGKYETTSMDVVIERKSKQKGPGAGFPFTNGKFTSTEISDLDAPIGPEFRNIKHFEPEVRRLADPPGVNVHLNPPIGQNPLPPHVMNPPLPQFRGPIQEPIQVMGQPRPMPVNAGLPLPPPHHPGMMKGPPGGSPGGPRFEDDCVIIGEDRHSPRHGSPELIRDHHDKSSRYVKVNNHLPRQHDSPRVLQREPHSRSPGRTSDYTPNTSSEEEDSILSARDEDSSETGDLSEDMFDCVPPRGSLYPTRRTSHRQREHSIYRSHSRKQPTEGSRHQYPANALVDIYPANSRQATRRPLSRRITNGGERNRPWVTHDNRHDRMLVPTSDMDYFNEKMREQRRDQDYERVQNLEDREYKVRRREEEVAHREKDVYEALKDRRYSLREPVPDFRSLRPDISYHPRLNQHYAHRH